MDSLKIQDAFEPYYAGRKRFSPNRKQSAATRSGKHEGRHPQQKLPAQAKRAGKAEKTEH